MASPQIPVVLKPSPVYNFWKILVKMCIIPLNVNLSQKKVTFKLMSKQTMIFLLYQFMMAAVFFLCSYMTGIENLIMWLKHKLNDSNTTDFVAMLCVMLLSCILPNCALYFLKELTYVDNEIILSPNLQVPKHWRKLVLSSVLNTVVTCLYMFIEIRYSSVEVDNALYSWWLSGSLFQIIYLNLNQFFYFFIILCLIDEFSRTLFIFEHDIIFHTNKSVYLFKTLQKGFEKTFLIFFSLYQTQNIFCLYMSISSNMSGNEDTWQNVTLSVCYFVMSAYFMVIMYCIAMTAEEAFDALQSLIKPLNKMLVNENDSSRQESIRIAIRKLEKTRPLNGNGYFNITRETLTSIVSTTITYLIILLQFRNN